MKINLSKAGQCNVLAAKKYEYYLEGTVLMASFNFVDLTRNPLYLKSFPKGENALHCVLLYKRLYTEKCNKSVHLKILY
jgi:hypothetical protein